MIGWQARLCYTETEVWKYPSGFFDVDIDKDSAKVTFPPPLVYIGVLLLGLVLDRFLPWSLGGGNGFSYFGAGLLLLSGVTCLLLASGKFRRLGTDLKPWKPTSAIADDGIYAVTRNPMYLGMAFVYLALLLLASSLGALILFPILIIIIRTQVIAREETYLGGKFGKEYQDYKAKTRRWL
jgi:protein-S-isoprenylcysteine O-methyltransferase Ste14